jgi:signal transduction histidine kinase
VVAFALVVGVLAVQVVAVDERVRGVGSGFDFGAVVFLVVATMLAVLARRSPVIGALGSLGVTVLWYQAGYAGGLINVPYLVSFYFLGASGSRRSQLLVCGFSVMLIAAAMTVAEEAFASIAIAVGSTVTAVVLGELSFSRRQLLAEYERRAVAAEVERELEAERREAQVRAEIARDLHDVLAHTVSVMTVQAAAAQDALERGSGGVEDALRVIRTAGLTARSEIAALLSVTRAEGASSGRSPAPRLGDLVDLTRTAASLGLEVDLRLDVPRGVVSDAVELTAFRVVQEALTNVARHATTKTVSIQVGIDGGGLALQVRNPGPPVLRPSGVGLGLPGMKERVESLNGRFRAGPVSEGGWQVSAWLPIEGLSSK